jgi:hypothetical protein
VDNTGWLQIPVTHVASNGAISDTNTLYISLTRSGNIGATGSTGATGPTGPTGPAGAGSDTPADNVFRITDQTDTTKKIAFEASGISTSTIRTVTMPDKDLTLIDEGTEVKSTGEGGGTKFLREDGDNSCSWQTAPVTSVSGSTGAVADGDIDHDSLANFAANEHFTQANITATGTVASGTWQGTAVDGTYVDLEGTELKSTGEAGGTKFLREDGDGTCSWQAGGIASVAADGSPQLGGFLDANGNYMQTEKGGDIASASPLVIDTDGDYFDVTGTTGFAAMTVAADRQFTLQFDGALTMTHHATNLDLPGEANITTAAGDVATFQSTGSNTVQCINYTKADGTGVVSAGIGTIPIFSAYGDHGGQAIDSEVTTKCAYDTEEFDSNSDYDTSLYRFTPTVAGKYLLIHTCYIGALGDAKRIGISIRRNGAQIRDTTIYHGAAQTGATNCIAIEDANGSSDYYEAFLRHDHGSSRTCGHGTQSAWFQGFKIAE